MHYSNFTSQRYLSICAAKRHLSQSRRPFGAAHRQYGMAWYGMVPILIYVHTHRKGKWKWKGSFIRGMKRGKGELPSTQVMVMAIKNKEITNILTRPPLMRIRCVSAHAQGSPFIHAEKYQILVRRLPFKISLFFKVQLALLKRSILLINFNANTFGEQNFLRYSIWFSL